MAMVNRFLKRRLGGYILESQSMLRAIGRPSSVAEQRFVLFGRGRSGSTLLVQMLDANPAIGCLDEVLRFSTLMPVRMVERELATLNKPIRGFKLLSYQIRELHRGKEGVLRAWMADPAVRIFHLRRDNVLRHALSNIYADARNAYHSTDASAAKTSRISVDPDDLFGWMRGSLDLLDWEQRFLDDLERTEIRYERDLATPVAQASTLERISAVLGVASVPAEVPLHKVTPRDYESFIANWPAVRARIEATEFKHYLDMPG